MRTIAFRVKGRGPFPIDMLRYADAWPSTSDDAARIQLSIVDPWTKAKSDRDHWIWLVTDRGGDREINCIPRNVIARFASFGWTIVAAHVCGGDDIDPAFFSFGELTQS